MIPTLYDCFKHWSEKGSVYLISDSHLEDSDCKLIDPHWPSPREYIDNLKRICHKTDTIIHLGDVGNPKYFKEIKSYKVLILGNHDETIAKFKGIFDEIYTGPLFIAEKILLSHEPVIGLNFCMNIHGHCHDKNIIDNFHFNIAANMVNYEPIELKALIKDGLISKIDSIHRQTIDRAGAKASYKVASKLARPIESEE